VRHTVLSLLFVATAARAGDAPPASPLLPPDHWAVAAARRLHEVGLAPDYFPAQRAVPLLVVAQALESGSAAARRAGSPAEPLASRWLERLGAEFPGLRRDETWVRLLGARVGGGYETGSAVSSGASGSPGPSQIDLVASRPDGTAELGLAATAGRHLAAGAALQATTSTVQVASIEVVGAAGPVALSVGRARVGYGPSEVGAVVAGGVAAVDRAEIMTTVPIRLPGGLAVLGEFAFDSTLARFDEPRHPYRPLLWQFDLQWRPHPRLTLGAVRGVMFGGTLWSGTSPVSGFLALLGLKNTVDNNVWSGTVEWMLPTERFLPLTAKLDWGSDDDPGALIGWPGLIVGLSAPMLPGLPASLGVEYAYFGLGSATFRKPESPIGWYSHGFYTGGWVTGQTPLGDPLGGNGQALRLVGSADVWDARVRLHVLAALQDRATLNLYAPAAVGRSMLAQGVAEYRLDRGAIRLDASHERGEAGWRRTQLAASGMVFF
jgi:hypothetical protein